MSDTTTTQSTTAVWRGHVVLLFSDLCDYTTLSEAHDPEDVEELRGQLERLTTDIIRKHRGVVTQVYGDGVLAVFGLPLPREDDGRCAVEAAVELHQGVRELRIASENLEAFSPRLHTGVHRGLVFARSGDALHGRYDLTGDAVNTTARLCAAARRDEILVSGVVMGGIEGFFAVEEGTEALRLKGKAQPVAAYRVTGRSGVATRFEARSKRGITSFVGRAQELAQLARALAAVRAGGGQLLAVMGPSGIGKTRLLEQLRESTAARDFLALYGTCESYGEAAPLEPFLQLVRRLFSLSAQTEPELAELQIRSVLTALNCQPDGALPKALARLSSGKKPLEPRDEQAAAIATAGASAAPGSPLTPEQALCQLFTSVAAQRNLLLMLDDWQWADDSSRSVLECLLKRPATNGVCIVIGTRPVELIDPLIARAQVIALEPFAEAESASVIRALRTEETDASLLRALHQHAGGNPLFLEELCRSLPPILSDDQPALLRSSQPSTVQAAIQVRIAALAPEQVETLSVAAIVGMEFSHELLARVLHSEQLAQSLAALVRSDLIFLSEEPATYRFKHGITREVVYENIRIAERRRLHGALAASIMERTASEHLAEQAEALAYHLRASGEYERAAHFAEIAGQKALAASALDRARAQFEGALTALDRLAPSTELKQRWLAISTRWALACVYAPARSQLALLERAVSYADELGETGARAQTRDALGWIYYVLGEYEQAIGHFEAALRLSEATQSRKLTAQLWANLGQTYAAAGRCEQAQLWLTRSIDEKRARVRHHGSAPALGFAYALACRGSVYAYCGEGAAARRDLREATAVVAGTGHPIEGSVYALAAMVALRRGAFDECVELAKRSREIAERVNSSYVYATATAYEAYAGFCLEQKPESLNRLEQAVALLERREHGLFLSFVYGCLAHARLLSRDLPGAEREAVRTLARAAAGDPLGETIAQQVLLALRAQRD